MAWDKVTKIDSIAKRKAYSKVNQGVIVEHASAYHRAGDRSVSNFVCPNNVRQATTVLTKSGKLRRAFNVSFGAGHLVSNAPNRETVRRAR